LLQIGWKRFFDNRKIHTLKNKNIFFWAIIVKDLIHFNFKQKCSNLTRVGFKKNFLLPHSAWQKRSLIGFKQCQIPDDLATALTSFLQNNVTLHLFIAQYLVVLLGA
jgi:hypothetical protein